MDQLIPVIDFLKKNKFWIVCGIIALTSIVMWFMSTNSIDGLTKKNEGTIKSSISTAENIKKVRPAGADDVAAHPNEETKKGMQAEIDASIASLTAAWKIRYEAQKDVAIWPRGVIKNPDFIDKFVDKFDPPETFPPGETGTSLKSYLALYKQQIPEQMANIAKQAKTFWMFDNVRKRLAPTGATGRGGKGGRGDDQRMPSGGGGIAGIPPQGMGRGDRGGDRGGARGGGQSVGGLAPEGAETEKPKPVVVWNKENQEYWNSKLNDFEGRDGNALDSNVPSPMQVFMLQQDLWLLEAMFQIIGKVNGDAIANDLATIKQIDHIAFGREARAVLGSVQEPVTVQGNADPAAAGGGGAESMLSRMERQNRMRGMPGFQKQAGVGELAADKYSSPFHGRYVDENFEPIPAETVRSVLKGKPGELPEKNLELIVAKRVPVRLGVVMKETKISEFIAECAKSPFTFEIHQVRINKHVPGEGIQLSGEITKKNKNGRPGDNLSIGGLGGKGGAGMEREGGRGSGDDGGDGVVVGEVDTRNSVDVKVEFYGVVKIYNKVDEARLSGQQNAAGAPAKTQP